MGWKKWALCIIIHWPWFWLAACQTLSLSRPIAGRVTACSRQQTDLTNEKKASISALTWILRISLFKPNSAVRVVSWLVRAQQDWWRWAKQGTPLLFSLAMRFSIEEPFISISSKLISSFARLKVCSFNLFYILFLVVLTEVMEGKWNSQPTAFVF